MLRAGVPRTLWFWGVVDGDAFGITAAAIASPPTVIQWIRCSSAAVATDTSVSVDILTAGIPSGTVLLFSGGTRATLSAQANPGDSSLTVTALPGGIAEGETAQGSVNVAMLRQVLIAMPAPTLSSGRPT